MNFRDIDEGHEYVEEERTAENIQKRLTKRNMVRRKKTENGKESGRWHYIDPFSILAEILKLDMAVGGGEQRVITAQTDIFAGMNPRAQLPHDNVAGFHRLAAEALDAPPLSLTIATVM